MPDSWDVTCLGDLVMDLVPHPGPEGQQLLAPSPGGAPGNVAAGLARLGRRALMIAKVGDEAFGREIVQALARFGVDTSGIVRDGAVKTRLSVVSHSPGGDRSFIFYKDDPADAALDAEEIAPQFVTSSQLLHVGSLLMASPRAAAAQEKAIALATVNGRPVSADPNIRRSLWPDMDSMIDAGRRLVASAQIVKLSEEELYVLSGRAPIAAAVHDLWHHNLILFAVTKGAEGAELFTSRHHIQCHGYRVDAVDTLAAGDAFMASLLGGLLDRALQTEDKEALGLTLRRACAAGAIAASRRGAMSSLPDAGEIERLLANVKENRPQPE
jgi:fructokinase